MGYFLPFLSPNQSKKSNFLNMKKHLEISPSDICVPIIMITWCMFPKILWHIAPPMILLFLMNWFLQKKISNCKYPWAIARAFWRPVLLVWVLKKWVKKTSVCYHNWNVFLWIWYTLAALKTVKNSLKLTPLYINSNNRSTS